MTTAPTPKGQATRERMLDTGIELMRASGLSGAGINEVVKASGMPKGSVYHFFPGGKEQLVGEALAVYQGRVRAFIEDAMGRHRSADRKVHALFAAFARRFETSNCRRSCAAGAVCLDLDDSLAGLRGGVHTAFACWTDTIADQLGWPDRRQARSFAGLVLSAIEGAYIRGRAEVSPRPFLEAGRWLATLARANDPH